MPWVFIRKNTALIVLRIKLKLKIIIKTSTKIKKLFDFSNYPKDSKFYNNTNNLVVSKIKNETCGLSIKCFVILKSKIYNFITEDNHESKKAKDIKEIVLSDELKYKQKMFCSIMNRIHNIES